MAIISYIIGGSVFQMFLCRGIDTENKGIRISPQTSCALLWREGTLEKKTSLRIRTWQGWEPKEAELSW